jgi:methionyl-tRNA formyltransferase
VIRIVFFGNSASAFTARHFQALLQTPSELVAVVDVPPQRRVTTNPLPAGLPNMAEETSKRNLPLFQPEKTNESSFLSALGKHPPDLFIAAGYALILKPASIQIPHLMAVNFHASLLPKYRGLHPVLQTLRAGERWAGLTVHAMDEGIDTGDILYQIKIRTRRTDSVSSLYDRIMDRSVKLVGQLIDDAEHDCIPRRPQSPEAGSYFSSLKAEDFSIDWRWNHEKIQRWISATPGRCYCDLRGQRLFLHQAEIAKLEGQAAPGTVVKLGRKRALIAVAKGGVSLGLGRFENGPIKAVASLLRQAELRPGDRMTISGTA